MVDQYTETADGIMDANPDNRGWREIIYGRAQRDAIATAIRSAVEAAERRRVAIKPLEWRFFDVKHDYGRGVWDANTPWKTLTIQHCTTPANASFPFYCPEISDQFRTLEEAQEAAQKWYERNVRSALVSAPDTTADVERRAYERAADVAYAWRRDLLDPGAISASRANRIMASIGPNIAAAILALPSSALVPSNGWMPIETAPKDRPILAWCDHEADVGIADETTGRLTLYAAHAEGLSHAPTGWHILEWGGGWQDSCEDGGAGLPDWWFVVGSEFEMAANPINWMPLPSPPADREAG